jgi:hypothetical protein
MQELVGVMNAARAKPADIVVGDPAQILQRAILK